MTKHKNMLITNKSKLKRASEMMRVFYFTSPQKMTYRKLIYLHLKYASLLNQWNNNNSLVDSLEVGATIGSGQNNPLKERMQMEEDRGLSSVIINCLLRGTKAQLERVSILNHLYAVRFIQSSNPGLNYCISKPCSFI